MFKRLSTIGVLLLWCLAVQAAPARQQARTAQADEDGRALLPDTLADWTLQSVQVGDFDGSTARILNEYGSVEAATATYVHRGRSRTVTVHRMRDGVAAYGAYSYFRDDPARADRTLSRLGEFLIFFPPGSSDASYDALASHLRPLQGRLMYPPALPDYLPRQGLISGSERYLMGPSALARFMPLAEGDWAGFSYGAEAQYAEYRLVGKQVEFLIIDYPTPQIAIARQGEWNSVLNLGQRASAGKPRVHTLREGTLLFLATGPDLEDGHARALLGAHRYGRDLSITDNEPDMFQEEWLSLVGDVFINSGSLTLLAMLLAIVLGTLRLAVSWLWPGRLFDRPDSTEILTLGIGRDDRTGENP